MTVPWMTYLNGAKNAATNLSVSRKTKTVTSCILKRSNKGAYYEKCISGSCIRDACEKRSL
jgi:hypothetical protein